MKVNCPHCGAHYSIDDRRIPAAGLNVKCPKCSATFPVMREAEAAPPPPPVEEPFAFDQQPGSIPLPAPENPFAMPPQEFADSPFAMPPQEFADNPFAMPPPQEPADNPFAMPPPQELEDSPFAMPPPQEPADNPFAMPPPQELADNPFAMPPPPELADNPFAMPPPAAAPQASMAPVSFGEIDFEADGPPLPPPHAAPPAPTVPDPFAAPARGAPPAAQGGEELEDLYGDSPKPAATPAPGGGATGPLSMDADFQVRRRSGKIFGPFPADAIAEMLQKGELQGNEDVSSDRGETWQPMSAVAVFRDAAGRANAPPPGGQPVPAVPFGSRIAPVKVGEGGRILRTRPRWVKYAVAVALVVVLAGVGVAGIFTPYGLFFFRAFRSDAERSRVAAIVGKAKAGLARGDFTGERDALKLATEALTAAPDDADARLVYVLAAGAVQQRHAAGPDAAQRAAAAAKGLADEAPGSAPALAAALALAVAGGDAAALAPGEAALEQAIAKEKPEPEIVALLARSALARRDGARAAAQLRRLEQLQPGTSRVALGLALALVAQGKGAEALPAFEKALASDATLSDARIEGAAAAAAAGDAARAKALLAPLVEPAAAGALSPLGRARMLTVSAQLLAGRAAAAPEVEKLLADAVAADGSFGAARIALANHRLRRSDPAGAVLATDPVAAGAAKDAELADVRVRALVGAGRALDASTLVDAALAASPGNPRLLVARGMVQEQTGKLAEAQASYRDAIARAPTGWEPRVALARLAMAAGNLALAQTEIAGAVERSAGAPAPLAALGELRQAEGDVAAAEAAFRKALALDGEHAPALIGLARISLIRGDLVGARADVERALAIDPGRVDARRLHGELLWKSGDLKGAEAELRSAADAAPRDAVGFARLGAVRLELGDVPGALKAAENATALDINLAEAQFWLGRALLAKGELPGALTRLKRAIDLDGANALHHLWYGVALERSSSLSEAVVELTPRPVARGRRRTDCGGRQPRDCVGRRRTAGGWRRCRTRAHTRTPAVTRRPASRAWRRASRRSVLAAPTRSSSSSRPTPALPLRPLRETASAGGELSRAMLAISGMVTLGDDVETLIFDEVDTGIGGAAPAARARRAPRGARRAPPDRVHHAPGRRWRRSPSATS